MDLLDIRVFEIPELNVERRVSDAGTIELPLLGEFPVSGLTAGQVRDQLQSMLTAKYVNRANVSVIVKEYANKPVSIVGAVQKTGSLNISGRWSLLQALSAAGGLTENAGKTIYVLRQIGKRPLRHAAGQRGRALPGRFLPLEHPAHPGGSRQRPPAADG